MSNERRVRACCRDGCEVGMVVDGAPIPAATTPDTFVIGEMLRDTADEAIERYVIGHSLNAFWGCLCVVGSFVLSCSVVVWALYGAFA